MICTLALFGGHDQDYVSVLIIHIRHPGHSQMLCKLAVTYAPPRFKIKPSLRVEPRVQLGPEYLLMRCSFAARRCSRRGSAIFSRGVDGFSVFSGGGARRERVLNL